MRRHSLKGDQKANDSDGGQLPIFILLAVLLALYLKTRLNPSPWRFLSAWQFGLFISAFGPSSINFAYGEVQIQLPPFACEYQMVPVLWEIILCQKSTHYKCEFYFWTLNSLPVTNTSPNAKNTLSWLACLCRHLNPLCSLPYCLGCSGSLWRVWTLGSASWFTQWSHLGAKRDYRSAWRTRPSHTTTSSNPWTWDVFSLTWISLHFHFQSPSLTFVMLILLSNWHTLEEGTEELPPSAWSVGMSMGDCLDWWLT